MKVSTCAVVLMISAGRIQARLAGPEAPIVPDMPITNFCGSCIADVFCYDQKRYRMLARQDVNNLVDASRMLKKGMETVILKMFKLSTQYIQLGLLIVDYIFVLFLNPCNKTCRNITILLFYVCLPVEISNKKTNFFF